MHRFFFVPFFCLSAIGCAPPSGADSQPTEEVENVQPAEPDSTSEVVLGVVQSLFDAMEARDSLGIQAALHAEAMFTSVNLTGEVPGIRRVEGAAFATSVGSPGPAYVERMLDPIVKHEGDFAGVWTAYDFSIGDSLSHCGHDAIQLVRESGTWKILGITYTRTACP